MAERSYLENLARSFTWGVTGGLVGLENPDEQVQEWRAENPVAALATDLIPLVGATAKGVSLLAKGTKYGKWAKSLGSAEKFAQHPFLSRAAQDAALIAPIELGRQAVGTVVQNVTDLEGPSLEERLWQSGTDIALGGAVAGTLGLLSSAGKKAPKVLADLSAEDSWQTNLTKARERLAQLSDQPEIAQEVQYGINKLERAIRDETRDKIVSNLEGIGDDSVTKLNRLFNSGGEVKSRKLLINPDTGFQTLKQLENEMSLLKESGTLPEDWLEHVQFPRLTTARTKAATTKIKNALQNSLTPVGNNWWLGREREGLYVIGRQLDNNRWFIAKTDDPGRFIPEQAQLKAVTERNAWRDPDTIYNPIAGKPENIYNKALKFNEALADGARGTKADSNTVWGLGESAVEKFGEKLGFKNIADSELLGNIKNTFSRYIAPTHFQFKDSPLARKIYAVRRKMRDDGLRQAQEFVYGKAGAGDANLWKVASSGIKREDPNSLGYAISKLAEKQPNQFDALLKVIDNQIPFEDIATTHPEVWSELGADGQRVLTKLFQTHNAAVEDIYEIAGALGIPEHKLFPLKKGHYGISHYWKGSLRQSLVDDKGNLVYIIGGENRKGLRKIADGVLEEAKKQGLDWRLGDYWTKDASLDLRQEKLLSPDDFNLADEFAQRYAQAHPEVGRASFFLPQSGVGGYNRAKTAQEVLGALQYSLENKYIWLTNEMADRMLAKDMATLAIDQPKVAAALQDKLDVIKGEQGVFSQLVNKTFDQVLAPVLGTNSASKIVSNLNKASVYLDLGFGNMAYAFANMLQPITTVLPQLSLLTSCPQALQWAYDGVPLISKSGKGMVVNTLSPMKIMWESMKLMSKPGLEPGFKEFMDWGIREGILSPRFIESYIGENSGQALALKEAFKQKDFAGMIKGLATTIPTYSEQASRAYAMTVGYKYFNSMAKAGMLGKEQVYQAAKKFTENTMFQFAASDRARILQGPVGSAWGLFKNWTMHYVGWQMQYLEAGLKHNAWKPYLYSNLATSMLGGLGSSEIGATMERFTEAYAGDKMSNLLYDRWGDTVGSQMLLYGLPGAFGLSLQSQVNSPFRDPGEEAQRFMGFVYGNRLKALWDSVDQAVDYYATTGKNPAGDLGFQQSILRALAPKMIYRSSQVVGNTLYSGSTRTKLADLTPLEALAYQYFNLPSARIDQAFQISKDIWQDKDKRSKLTSSYSDVMADAMQAGDGTLMYRIIERALVDGVDIGGMVDGAQSKLQNRYMTPLERNTDYYGIWGTTASLRGL